MDVLMGIYPVFFKIYNIQKLIERKKQLCYCKIKKINTRGKRDEVLSMENCSIQTQEFNILIMFKMIQLLVLCAATFT